MPRVAPQRSALAIQRLSRPGRYAVGGVAGLSMAVSPSGAKSWVLRVMAGGRRREFGLGGYPSVTLEQARHKAREAREHLSNGIDPAQERRAAADALRVADAKRITFRTAAQDFLKRKRPEFRNPKHAKQWATTLETYAYPVMGNLPVNMIELAHVKRTLDPLWGVKTETAKRLRGRIESVIAYATASGYRSGDNPARWRGNLDAVMPKPSKITTVKHHRALPVSDLPAFMRDLRARDGMAPRALEFAILTAARSGEVRGAVWSEIDFSSNTWTVPAGRMKALKEHIVPLTPSAIDLLKNVPRMASTELVFPASKGVKLSDMALSAVTRRMGVDAVPHGFRSTFRDWAAERTNYPREVAEMALAHTIENKVEAAYRRGSLLDKRRKLMNEWDKFCSLTTSRAGEVVSLQRSKV